MTMHGSTPHIVKYPIVSTIIATAAFLTSHIQPPPSVQLQDFKFAYNYIMKLLQLQLLDIIVNTSHAMAMAPLHAFVSSTQQ